MKKGIDQGTVLLVGLALVVILSLKQVGDLTSAIVSSVRTAVPEHTTLPTRDPYPTEFRTIENGVACNARSRMSQPQNAPLMPPKDDTWFSCWEGSIESARGPRGSTECVGVYNGKKSPPRKFKHMKGQWYGCNFNTEGEGVWECPSCTIKPDATSFP